MGMPEVDGGVLNQTRFFGDVQVPGEIEPGRLRIESRRRSDEPVVTKLPGGKFEAEGGV